MIFPGQVVQTQVLCPECGKPMTNRTPPGSAFLMCACGGDGCSGAMLLIEKSTAMVIWTSATGTYDGERWTHGFPMLADKDGKQLWPKPPKSKVADDKPYHIKKHVFVDRHSPADNTCLECGYMKDDSIHKSECEK